MDKVLKKRKTRMGEHYIDEFGTRHKKVPFFLDLPPFGRDKSREQAAKSLFPQSASRFATVGRDSHQRVVSVKWWKMVGSNIERVRHQLRDTTPTKCQ